MFTGGTERRRGGGGGGGGGCHWILISSSVFHLSVALKRNGKIITGSAMVKCPVKPSSLMDYFYSTAQPVNFVTPVKFVTRIL